MIKLVFADQDVFADYAPCLDALEPLKGKAEITAYGEDSCSEEERYERLKDADVIAFGVHKFSNAFLARLKKLKMLQFMGTGYMNFVDADYCEKAGIKIGWTEDYGSNAVAEYTIAQVFALARNIASADRRMRKGEWTYSGLEGLEISGSTFGVVGTGNIGSLVAQKARALGAGVIAHDVYEKEELKSKYGVRYAGLDELFEKSDIITLHVKYFPETTAGLISARLIGKMKSSAILVNNSRAEILDNDALFKALSTGAIRGAALDVFLEEPLTDFSLCQLPNITTSPHIGFFTGKAKGNCLRMSVSSIMDHMKL